MNADSPSDFGNDPDAFQLLTLRRQTLHEQIADAIQEMIASQQLQRGSQLPSERKLAEMLGVNRATVREAIRLLEQRGLVEMRVGSGTYVFEVLSPTLVADSIARLFTFGDGSHEELLTLREILEPEVAALAAQNAKPEDLVRLRELVGTMERTFYQPPGYAKNDMAFHEALTVATGNSLIIAVAAGLHKVNLAWMERQHEVAQYEDGCLSHRKIYEAIVAHDPERAREAMRFHMTTSRRTLELVRARQAAARPPSGSGPVS
jgi:GntR family transcriptional regulator, transcriptional repressor for pyruvate dehydrogenase complex